MPPTLTEAAVWASSVDARWTLCVDAWRVDVQWTCETLANRSQVACKSVPTRLPNRFPDGEKSMPESLQIDAWRPQNHAPEAPKSSQGRLGGSGSVPKRPKSVQERPKSAPRVPQDHPREPKSALGGLQKHPGALLGRLLRLESSKKPSFKSALSRDSLEKRVRNEFRMILKECAQARECKKTLKTCCFPRFF